MKAKPERGSPEEIAQFRKNLSLKIERLVAESLEAWSTCENRHCRRAKRCASKKRECIARWNATKPPLTPEQAEQSMNEFRIALKRRLAGLPLGQAANKTSGDNTRAAMATSTPPVEDGKTPPVAAEPQLSPEKQARIDRAWNEYVTEQEKPKRERRPRITRL
jgi:hypothetical protein